MLSQEDEYDSQEEESQYENFGPIIGETPPIVEGGGPSSAVLNTHSNVRSTQQNTMAVTEVVLDNNGISRFHPNQDDESNINTDDSEEEEEEQQPLPRPQQKSKPRT